jgi:hypothetical protein
MLVLDNELVECVLEIRSVHSNALQVPERLNLGFSAHLILPIGLAIFHAVADHFPERKEEAEAAVEDEPWTSGQDEVVDRVAHDARCFGVYELADAKVATGRHLTTSTRRLLVLTNGK